MAISETERSDERIDVAAAIDSAPIGWFIISIAIMCAIVALLDGFDTIAISYVAPLIGSSWKLPKEAFGLIFSAHYIGAAIGAALFGVLGDRYGRRPIIMTSTALFGVFALLTPLAYDFVTLLTLRFLTGIGLGGALSAVIALVSEYSPVRHRATLVSLMYAAFPLGGVVGGPLSAYVIANYGWQPVFLIGGIAPILFVVVLAFALPESLRFLSIRGADPKRINAIMRRLLPGTSETYPKLASLQTSLPPTRSTLRELFSSEYSRLTILLSFASFVTQLIIVYVFTWMPTLLTSAGLPLSQAILVSATFSLGGIVGSLVLARLIDQQSSYRALILAYLASAVCVGSIGFSTSNSIALFVAVGMAGVTIIGAQINLSAYTSTVYPTGIRSTGIGWAVGVGRLGAIAGALLGTALFAAGIELQSQYLIAGAPAVLAGVAVAMTRGLHQSRIEMKRAAELAR